MPRQQPGYEPIITTVNPTGLVFCPGRFAANSMKQAILVVDDDASGRCLLEAAFKSEAPDVAVDYVYDGKEAINYLQGKAPFEGRPTPGLMLLDLKMPQMDGFEVLEWLQRCPEVRPAYVVVFSTSDQKQDKDRAWELGADGYLVKAMTFENSRQQIRVLAHYAREGAWVPTGSLGLEWRRRSTG